VPDKRDLVIAIVAATAAAIACNASVQFATPIDRALPFLAVVAVALAFVSERPAIAMAVPLLIVVENVIADEATRLLAIGVVVGVGFLVAGCRWPVASQPSTVNRQPFITLLAVLVLRWIPFHDVVLWRELIVLIGAVAVAYVMQGSALATVVALFCPAWPAKVAVLLFLVMIGAAFWLRRIKFAAPLVVAILVAFFPWSGIMARGWRAFIDPPRQSERREIRNALHAGQSTTIDIPPGTESLIVSGANVQRLPRGTLLGTVNGAPIRIGDASDWGFMRRDQFFASRNGYPRNPAGRIRDYGWSSWIDGAGRILLKPDIRTVTVTADPHLPNDAALQVESIEMVSR